MKRPSEYKAKQVKPLLVSESARDSEIRSVIFPITVEKRRDDDTAQMPDGFAAETNSQVCCAVYQPLIQRRIQWRVWGGLSPS